MSQDLAQLESATLSLTAASAPDEIAAVLDKLAFMARAIREAKQTLDARLLEIIEETGRDIVVGEVRYYAGNPSDTSCNDKAETLDALLVTTGGDVKAVADCLCSEPFKYGACRGVLGDEAFGRLFTVTRKAKLEKGKPTKQLMSVNEQFSKGRK